MAFQSHRTRFKGDLVGIKQETISTLDYDKEVFEDRKEYIDEKYKNITPYHEEYTSEYFKVNVNTNDNLSGDINIFKAIEKDGSYLLNSVDIPRDGQQKYNILTQEEFDEAIRKEKKSEWNQDEIMDVLKSPFSNDYINMDLIITNADLKECSEMGQKLREYNILKEHLKQEMNKIKNGEGSYLKLYQIKRLLGDISGDMLDIKRSYKGITRPSTKLGDIGSQPDYDSIKYTNPKHVKAIITNVRFGEIEPDSILSHMAYDMKRAVEALYDNKRLDDIDIEIVESINSGITMRALEKELGISNQAISKRFDKIAEKISGYYTYLKLEPIDF